MILVVGVNVGLPLIRNVIREGVVIRMIIERGLTKGILGMGWFLI